MSSIFSYQKGNGSPVILIHGFCETSAIWAELAETLSEKYTVIVPDLPGCGRSNEAPEGFQLADIAQMMLTWMKEEKIDLPIVIGHSMGGYVALAMAALAPDALAGLGLFHSTAAADSDERKATRNKVIDFVRNHGVEAYTGSFIPGLFFNKHDAAIPEVLAMGAATKADTLCGYAAAMRDRPASFTITKSFQQPILYVAGEHDMLIPVKQLLQESGEVRHPVFSTLKGAAHMGMKENEPGSSKFIADFAEIVLTKGER